MCVFKYTLPRRNFFLSVRINDLVVWGLYLMPLPSSFTSESESIIFHFQRQNYGAVMHRIDALLVDALCETSLLDKPSHHVELGFFEGEGWGNLQAKKVI